MVNLSLILSRVVLMLYLLTLSKYCIHEVILADIPKHSWEYFIYIFYSLYILFYLLPKF